MLSEELLKGSFHDLDTITVKVTTDEAGEKKLAFDATKTAAAEAPVAVAAGEAK